MVRVWVAIEQVRAAPVFCTPVQVEAAESIGSGEVARGFHSGKTRTSLPEAGMGVVGVIVSSAGPYSPTLAGEAVATSED